MQTFPLYINNRDRLTYTRELAEQCSRLQMVGDIIIVDNASTYEPLLDWYETCPYKVVKLSKNMGTRGAFSVLDSKTHYVCTDNDLDISNVPKHVLDLLFDGLNRHKEVIKAGLSLEIDDIPDEYHLKTLALQREQGMWEHWPGDQRFYKGAIDTTFAMYRPNHGWIGYEPALRARRPYTARHRPWYALELDEEDRYYIEHLLPESSVYGGISQAKGIHKEPKQQVKSKLVETQKDELLKQRYDRLLTESSDIKEHLPELSRLAKQCKHVTEFGTRNCNSTTALFYGLSESSSPTLARLVCYDKNSCDCVEYFNKYGLKSGYPNFEFHKQDTASKKLEIRETDLLFIDTWHVYEQLKAELALHSDKVRRWIVLHDTKTFGEHGESGEPGLWKAVEEFLEEGTFVIQDKFENQNGLTVLVRKDKS